MMEISVHPVVFMLRVMQQFALFYTGESLSNKTKADYSMEKHHKYFFFTNM